MNRDRRKAIQKVKGIVESALESLEGIRDEEQDAYDNLPEGIMDSERGERMSECIDSLESAIGNLEEAVENLDEDNYA